MLPDTKDLLSSSSDVLATFPPFSLNSLCQHDLILMFRLVSLHTTHILQSPIQASSEGKQHTSNSHTLDESNENLGNEFENDPSSLSNTSWSFVPSFDVLSSTGCFGFPGVQEIETESKSSNSPLNLKGLLEAIRKGRVFLLNAFQVWCLRTILFEFLRLLDFSL